MKKIIVILIFASLSSCKREERSFRVQPPNADAADKVIVTDLRAGQMQATNVSPSATQPAGGPIAPPPSGIAPASQPSRGFVKNGYEENAYAVTEGGRLYNTMNCVGCHFHGGGGIGPPLMDDKWIYGSNPEQIFSTIVEGRPNGMPSFRGKIVDYQVWQIVAYVRSLSGQVSTWAAPGRDDHMTAQTPPNSMKPQYPVMSVDRPSGG